MATGDGRDTKEMRRKFKPDQIRVLLVGESPAEGAFFYDWAAPTAALARQTKRVFEGVYRRNRRYLGKLDFLYDFKLRGFYLYDLLEVEGERLEHAPMDARRVAEEGLATFLETEEPEAVYGVKMGLRGAVGRALMASGLRPRYEGVLPFPGPQWSSDFRRGLRRLIEDMEGQPKDPARLMF